MNRIQRIILFLGLVVIAFFCLCPPCQLEHTVYLINRETRVPHKAGAYKRNYGHGWIWAAPQGDTQAGHEGISPTWESNIVSVDWARLGIYVGLTAALTLFLAFGFSARNKLRAAARGDN